MPQAILAADGTLLSEPTAILREWRAFFQGVGTAVDDGPAEARQGNSLDFAFKRSIEEKLRKLLSRAVQYNPELDQPFTLLELRRALAKLRRRTAVGPDGVPNAFLKLMGPTAWSCSTGCGSAVTGLTRGGRA